MLLFLLIVPILVAVAFFVFTKTVCWKEFLCTLTAVVVVNVVGYLLSFSGATSDVELLNGRVKSKAQEIVSCSHSYECMCHNTEVCSGTGSSRTCHTQRHCSTCYEHNHDYDWEVRTSVGTIDIARVPGDSQGTREPPRFTLVELGEPATVNHSFTNYIKAAPGSVLLTTNAVTGFERLLPPYPSAFDYYRAHHLVVVGMSAHNFAAVNKRLNQLNATLGPAKQVNTIFVVAKTGDPAYFHALEEHWLGGKKNDVVVVVGVPDGQDKIAWAKVMSWSEVELLKVMVRDEVMKAGSLTNLPAALDVIEPLISKHYNRKAMADFAYLRYQYSPSTGIMALLFFVGLAISIAMSLYFMNEDPFDSGIGSRPGSRRRR